jgi:anti-sigma regulatory factor (Ser/Thr protein kinase)
MSEPALVIDLDNDLSEVSRLAEAVEAFATAHGVPPGTIFAVNLALEELVTNTISYGYPDGGRHRIHLRFTLQGDTLQVAIQDDGLAFNPLNKAEPNLDAPIEDRPIGGLGIHLVRKLMDDVRYERRNEQNCLWLAKKMTEGESLL